MSKFTFKNKKIILIIAFALIFLGFFFFSFHTASKTIAELDYKDTIPGSLTVYDFMDKLRSEGKMNFTEKEYTGMGKFIESINGIQNSSSQFWIYYVNGQEAQVGVSNYKINTGDILSWKYEK